MMARPISHDPSYSSYPATQDPVPTTGTRCVEPICCACSLLCNLATKIAELVSALFNGIVSFFTQPVSATIPPVVDLRREGKEFLCALFRKCHYTPEVLRTTDRSQLLTDLARNLVCELVMDAPQNPPPVPYFARDIIYTNTQATYESKINTLRRTFNNLEETDRAHARTQFIEEAEISSPGNGRFAQLLRHANVLAFCFSRHEPFISCVNEAIADFTSEQTV